MSTSSWCQVPASLYPAVAVAMYIIKMRCVVNTKEETEYIKNAPSRLTKKLARPPKRECQADFNAYHTTHETNVMFVLHLFSSLHNAETTISRFFEG
jgi:hypothetical protein